MRQAMEELASASGAEPAHAHPVAEDEASTSHGFVETVKGFVETFKGFVENVTAPEETRATEHPEATQHHTPVETISGETVVLKRNSPTSA